MSGGAKVHGFAVSAKEAKFLVGSDVASIFRPAWIRNPHGKSHGYRTTAEGRLAGTVQTKYRVGDFLWVREEVMHKMLAPEIGQYFYSTDKVVANVDDPELNELGYSANRMPCSLSRTTIRIDYLEEIRTKQVSFPTPEQIQVGTLNHMQYAYTRLKNEFSLDWDERWPRTGWKFDDNPIAMRITGRVIHCNIIDVLGDQAPAFLKGTGNE